jgi:hypothetical protein
MTQRIWDPYLTPADKEYLSSAADKRVGFVARPALLLVDLYRAVFGDKPEPLMQAIKTWPASCGMAGWTALPHIQQLLAAARAAGIPVIHITMLADSGMPGWNDAIHHSAQKAQPRDEILELQYSLICGSTPQCFKIYAELFKELVYFLVRRVFH